jgi:hydrogenase expression/formation protein HypE
VAKRVSLVHGAGGRAMMDFISDVFLRGLELKRAGKVGLDELDDGATIEMDGRALVLTTDSHTVKPIFFPGGDIGRLAAAGTVNDLSVMGAKPMAMSCAIVVEEGFPVEDLERITASINLALKEVSCPLVTGDFKVVGKGELDGIVITTTGLGLADQVITDRGLGVGDVIIVTGTVGDHGMTILANREGIRLETDLVSDVAPVWEVVEAALKAGGVTAMKDPTRGGLAAALNEMASKSGIGILLSEESIPISDPVKAAGEILGIDPLQITNEGKVVMGVKRESAERVLESIRKTKYGKNAAIIGEVISEYPGEVILETSVGGRRILESPVGDPAPRIC